jgi:hypothetical protein
MRLLKHLGARRSRCLCSLDRAFEYDPRSFTLPISSAQSVLK